MKKTTSKSAPFKKGMSTTSKTPMSIPIPAAKKESAFDNSNDKHGKFKIKK